MVYALPEYVQPHVGNAVRTLREWFDVDAGRISVTKILLVLFNISAVH